MSFKIVIFVAVAFACQVNAQMGIIRPFATGFTNGISEMAKPFVQLGQSVMSPASEYFSAGRRPAMSQWMAYPSQMIPQAQAQAYEGFETVSSAIPGANYFQAVRPPTVMKPQTQYFQIPSQTGGVRPPRPFPAPAPASSLSEETAELYRPSNLLKPKPAEIEIPKPEEAMTLEGKFEIPTMQRPLPLIEDSE